MPERVEAPVKARPTRRELRAAGELGSVRRSRASSPRSLTRLTRGLPTSRRWVPRTLVLAALGATTIAAPLSGAATSDFDVFAAMSASASESVAPVDLTESALDRLDDAAFETEARASATELVGVNTAANRALISSSRSLERTVLACSDLSSSANGARAALTAAPLVFPLTESSYSISSTYGDRYHPILGYWAMHSGLDFAAPLGTPIHAVADGVVEYVGDGIEGRSNVLVIIRHELDGESFYSWYVHMYPDGVFVSEGDSVLAGEVFAEVGNNGNSTGPHLHLEIHTDTEGTTVDPEAFLSERDAVELPSQSCAP